MDRSRSILTSVLNHFTSRFKIRHFWKLAKVKGNRDIVPIIPKANQSLTISVMAGQAVESASCFTQTPLCFWPPHLCVLTVSSIHKATTQPAEKNKQTRRKGKRKQNCERSRSIGRVCAVIYLLLYVTRDREVGEEKPPDSSATGSRHHGAPLHLHWATRWIVRRVSATVQERHPIKPLRRELPDRWLLTVNDLGGGYSYSSIDDSINSMTDGSICVETKCWLSWINQNISLLLSINPSLISLIPDLYFFLFFPWSSQPSCHAAASEKGPRWDDGGDLSQVVGGG